MNFPSFFLALFILSLATCSPRPPEGMVLVSAGAFRMGTDDLTIEALGEEAGLSKPLALDASPQHRLKLPAFFIDQNEVSHADYFLFVKDLGFPWLPHWKQEGPLPDQMNQPVTYVNWFEAQSFCYWTKKRLPTEREWEKAARGTDGRRYPWGNQFDPSRANLGGRHKGLLDVGSLSGGKSPYGISDAIGNAWEWTEDWYGPYPNSKYQSEDFGERFRVIRGHSWSPMGHFTPDLSDRIIAAQGQVTYRWYLPPRAALEDVGFRCARSIK